MNGGYGYVYDSKSSSMNECDDPSFNQSDGEHEISSNNNQMQEAVSAQNRAFIPEISTKESQNRFQALIAFRHHHC